MDATTPVSKVPAITPELLEQNEEEQKRWRALYEVRHVSAESYADIVIKDNLNILDALEAQLGRARFGEKALIREKIKQIRNDTATWLASIGRFETAAKLATAGDVRSLYKKYIKAIALDDSEWCEHPLFEQVDGNWSQVAYREFEFFSDAKGCRISMVRCRRCGFRNARDLDADLQKLSNHRAAAVAAGKDAPVSLKEVIK